MRRRLRIRSKLLIWLFVAGFVPLLGGSYVAFRIVRSRLEETLRAETQRSLRICLNLALARVQAVSEDAARMAADPDLRAQLAQARARAGGDSDALTEALRRLASRYRARLDYGTLTVRDPKDRPLARLVLGGAHPPQPRPPAKPTPRTARNRYQRSVDLVASGCCPAILATAPVIDENFNVLGALEITVPLDHRFAVGLRSTLGVHVGFLLGSRPVASSLEKENGAPLAGLPLEPDFLRQVHRNRARVGAVRWQDRIYSVGAVPLVSSRGLPLGALYVALDRQTLEASRLASYRSLLLGGAGVLLLAFLIATFAAQGLSRPLTRLHARAMAVARGDLSGRIGLPPGDEVGDLAAAFDRMTDALQENQRRLSDRINEIITLHNIGRSVTSVVGFEEVLETVVDEIRRALDATAMAILLEDEEGRPRLRAYQGPEDQPEPPSATEPEAGESAPAPSAPEGGAAQTGDAPFERTPETKGASLLEVVGRDVQAHRKSLCIDGVQDHPDYGPAARQAGLAGSILSVPLVHKGRCLGSLVLHRAPDGPAFGEADVRLLSTFADQASTAIENARLYAEVTRFNEQLEHMVAERTAELTHTNEELANALHELQEAQAQLILSERLAGLGQLVAGIAHEVNTPAAAIGGAAENLERSLVRLLGWAQQLASLGLTVQEWQRFMQEVARHAERRNLSSTLSPAEARAAAKRLAEELAARGVEDARRMARRLVDLDAAESATTLLELGGRPERVAPLVGCLQELLLLRRNSLAIGTAIATINRIVQALRAYSHLDQTRVDRINLHDGIETTLVILGSRLKGGVTVTKRYGELPPVPVYVDELNQVWTNLLTNAIDAVEGQGEIVIETEALEDEVVVRITDTGAGIPPDVLPRIFKPFFTTKPQGKGTGLGLGICRRIVEKHGGRLEAESRPGRTVFSVFLPKSGPPASSEGTLPEAASERAETDGAPPQGSPPPATRGDSDAPERTTEEVSTP